MITAADSSATARATPNASRRCLATARAVQRALPSRTSTWLPTDPSLLFPVPADLERGSPECGRRSAIPERACVKFTVSPPLIRGVLLPSLSGQSVTSANCAWRSGWVPLRVWASAQTVFSHAPRLTGSRNQDSSPRDSPWPPIARGVASALRQARLAVAEESAPVGDAFALRHARDRCRRHVGSNLIALLCPDTDASRNCIALRKMSSERPGARSEDHRRGQRTQTWFYKIKRSRSDSTTQRRQATELPGRSSASSSLSFPIVWSEQAGLHTEADDRRGRAAGRRSALAVDAPGCTRCGRDLARPDHLPADAAGTSGRPFTFYKFRSMTTGSDDQVIARAAQLTLPSVSPAAADPERGVRVVLVAKRLNDACQSSRFSHPLFRRARVCDAYLVPYKVAEM